MSVEMNLRRSNRSWTAARRRMKASSGSAVPWRMHASRLSEQAVYVVIFGGLAVQAVRAAAEQDGPGTGPALDVSGYPTGLTLLLTVLGFCVLLKVLLAVGPVSTSAAVATWLLGSPLDRRTALLRPVAGVFIASTVVSLFWPSLVFLLTGFGVPVSSLGILVSGAMGAACVGLAVCIQAARPRVADPFQKLLSLVAAASVVALVVDRVVGGWVLDGLHVDSETAAALPIAAVVLVVIAVLLIGTGILTLGRLTRSALSSGRTMAVGLTLSVTSFEFGLLGALMTERWAIRKGHVRSMTIGRRSWLFSMILTDLVRLARAPGKLLTVGGLLLLPVLFASGASGSTAELVPAVFTLGAFLVADRLAGTQRVVLRSAGVLRLLGVSRRRLSLALGVLPLLGTALWCGFAAALTGGLSIANIVVAVVGAVLVVLRIATRPPLSFDDPMMFDFGMLGPTPLGLIKQISRGPILLIALMLVQVTVL